MQILQIVFQLAFLADIGATRADESPPADAILTEHIRSAIARLDDTNFQRREAAVDELFSSGIGAIPALMDASRSDAPEVSARAFDVLNHLYRCDDEPTFEAVEQAFQQLKHDNNLTTAARAERFFEYWAETRQIRAIAQFERLGGIIRVREPNQDRHQSIRPMIDYVMVGRDWAGGDDGIQLLGRIEDLRNSNTALYIIRGVDISDVSIGNLRRELPFINIERRGPARLGVRSNGLQQEEGCSIDGVDPGSAAEKAGLKKDDVILKIDGQMVENFKMLISIIESKEPGDKIPIVFRREREPELQEVVAELSAWSKPRPANIVQPPPQPKP